MEEKKATNAEQIRLRRAMELHEFALAAFYPLTHAGISVPRKRIKDKRLSAIDAHPLLSALTGNHLPPKSLAKARDEPVERGAVTPQVERLLRRVSEHTCPQSPDEPKPWKKPWDK
jgi:hypothetical protein